MLREDFRFLITPFESFLSCLFKNQNGFVPNLLGFRRSKFRVSGFFSSVSLVFGFLLLFLFGCGSFWILYGAVVSVSRSCVWISLSVGFSFLGLGFSVSLFFCEPPVTVPVFKGVLIGA